MRAELKEIGETDYWVYGLSITDLDYTLIVANNLIQSSRQRLDLAIKDVRTEYPDPDVHGELISDLAHYTWTEQQYLWHFCLWRLQGIMEGIIVYCLLERESSSNLKGLYAKLSALRKAGYSLEDDEQKELIEWGKLRNALSHAPPEQFRPGPLNDEDVYEYKEYVRALLVRWMRQKGEK